MYIQIRTPPRVSPRLESLNATILAQPPPRIDDCEPVGSTRPLHIPFRLSRIFRRALRCVTAQSLGRTAAPPHRPPSHPLTATPKSRGGPTFAFASRAHLRVETSSLDLDSCLSDACFLPRDTLQGQWINRTRPRRRRGKHSPGGDHPRRMTPRKSVIMVSDVPVSRSSRCHAPGTRG